MSGTPAMTRSFPTVSHVLGPRHPPKMALIPPFWLRGPVGQGSNGQACPPPPLNSHKAQLNRMLITYIGKSRTGVNRSKNICLPPCREGAVTKSCSPFCGSWGRFPCQEHGQLSLTGVSGLLQGPRIHASKHPSIHPSIHPFIQLASQQIPMRLFCARCWGHSPATGGSLLVEEAAIRAAHPAISK